MNNIYKLKDTQENNTATFLEADVKITINRDDCIECGSCESICADVFHLPSGEKSTIVEKYRTGGLPEQGEVPASLEACTQESADACPVSAISTQK